MRQMLLVFSLIAVFAGPSAIRAEEKSAFLAADNWEGLKEYWKIDGNTVVGTAPEGGLKFNTFLCSKKKYSDFEMKFSVRLKGGVGNSGIQIRSKIHNMEKFAVTGPQCDIGQQYWGSLYGENFGGMMKAAPAEVVKKIVKQDDFNLYSIRCVGKHVTIKINGETMVDGDFEKMPADGIIAFQLHSGPQMEVTFKDIEFKEVK